MKPLVDKNAARTALIHRLDRLTPDEWVDAVLLDVMEATGTANDATFDRQSGVRVRLHLHGITVDGDTLERAVHNWIAAARIGITPTAPFARYESPRNNRDEIADLLTEGTDRLGRDTTA